MQSALLQSFSRICTPNWNIVIKLWTNIIACKNVNGTHTYTQKQKYVCRERWTRKSMVNYNSFSKRMDEWMAGNREWKIREREKESYWICSLSSRLSYMSFCFNKMQCLLAVHWQNSMPYSIMHHYLCYCQLIQFILDYNAVSVSNFVFSSSSSSFVFFSFFFNNYYLLTTRQKLMRWLVYYSTRF